MNEIAGAIRAVSAGARSSITGIMADGDRVLLVAMRSHWLIDAATQIFRAPPIRR